MPQRSLTIDDYYQLIVLHKSLMHLKFSKSSPMDAVLLASPMLAEITNELVDILEEIESERDNSTNTQKWRFEIEKGSATWSSAVRNAKLVYKDDWHILPSETKKQIAQIFLSPFVTNNELIIEFIEDVGKAIIQID